MFSRKRSKSNPPKAAPPTNSAALLGATRAFVKPGAANGGLSSAAAAAALRANPSAPIQVGAVQTKRMVRRGSNSSMASAPGDYSQGRPSLQRKTSNGSMSERSFRAQSPSNNQSSNYPSNWHDMYAPPVPAIPKKIQEQSHRRSASIDRPPRVVTPKQKERGLSDRGPGSASYGSPHDRSMSLTDDVRSSTEEVRRSINFSRPMSPALPSPRESPVQREGHSGWFTEPVTPEPRSTGLRNEVKAVSPPSQKADLGNVQQTVRNAAEKPVVKKQQPAAIEGKHLAKSGMAAKPTGTAVQKQPSTPTNQIVFSPSSIKPPLAAGGLKSEIQRSNSTSPARSAHFSDTGLEVSEVIRHNPPPRSISPAKSALKRHGTSPGRTASPRFSSAVSEASDTVSDDGRMSSTKKKKNVRVSFDEGIVESTEYPPTSPTRGLGASRWSGQTAVEDDIDEIMKPRPALPSFGSLRGRKNRDDDNVAEKVTETVTSSMTNSVSTIAESQEASKDRNLGKIFTQDLEKKSGLEPIPPEVTSIDGYQSDSDISSINTSDGAHTLARPPTPPHTATAPTVNTSSKDHVTSPIAIAVQPPTPKAEEEQEDMFSVPGSWADEEESRDEVPALPQTVEEKAAITEKSSTNPAKQVTTAEPITQSLSEYQSSPSRDADHDVGLSILEEESESDGASIYSDAEEELSDGGGFASLDAIANSPLVVTPKKQGPKLSIEVSPLASKSTLKAGAAPATAQSPQSPSHDWDEAKQYWNNLSKERKQEIEREEAFRTAVVSSPESAVAKPKKKKRAEQPASPVGEAIISQPRQAKQQQQPPKPALKKTMRAEPEPKAAPVQPRASMRKSMRGPPPGPQPGNGPLRQTMRTNEPTMRGPTRPGLSASRYSGMSDSEDERGRPARREKLHIEPLPTVPPPSVRPKSAVGLGASRHGPRAPVADDNDSDASESSFRRQRASKRGGAKTMRRSMRGGPQGAVQTAPPPTKRPASMMNSARPSLAKSGRPSSMMGSLRPTSPDFAPRSSRMSVRSLSPTGSMFRRGRFRAGSIDSGAPTMREEKRPSSRGSIFSFGGKKDKKQRPMSSSSAAPRAAPRFQSRFADSDDTDDEMGSSRPAYNSRFAESDDDDEDIPPIPAMPKSLTPVRGIPRRNSASSTDLEDEFSDREQQQKQTKTPTVTAPLKGKQGGALTSGSLRDSKHARIADDTPEPSSTPVEKKKRGFFGLGRSSKKASASREQLPSFRPESPPPASSPTTGRSPKLQRRNTPQRVLSDSWPLPAPPKIGQELRPQSSDGPLMTSAVGGGDTRRPPLGERVTSGGTVVTAPIVRSDAAGRDVIVGRSGKKKKFQGLRKAFGLRD